MKQLIWVGLMMVLLTACIKDIKFDGYDPTTAMVRWIFTHDANKIEKDEPYAPNASR